MRHQTFIAALLLLASMSFAACQALPRTGQSTPAAGDASKYSGDIPITALTPDEAGLIKTLEGIDGYKQAKAAALAAGWQAVKCEKCQANVVGGNYKEVCSKRPHSPQCTVCDTLPELNSCSGDGYCLMQFKSDKSARILKIATYGDYADLPNLVVHGVGFDDHPSE